MSKQKRRATVVIVYGPVTMEIVVKFQPMETQLLLCDDQSNFTV